MKTFSLYYNSTVMYNAYINIWAILKLKQEIEEGYDEILKSYINI